MPEKCAKNKPGLADRDLNRDPRPPEHAGHVEAVDEGPSQRPSGDLEPLGLLQDGLLVAALGRVVLQVVPALALPGPAVGGLVGVLGHEPLGVPLDVPVLDDHGQAGVVGDDEARQVGDPQDGQQAHGKGVVGHLGRRRVRW